MKKGLVSQHFRVSLAQSVRTRLTLWYLAVMAFIVIVYGGTLYASETLLNADVAQSRIESELYQASPQFAEIYKQALLDHQKPTDLHLNPSAQEMLLLLSPDGRVLDSRGPLTNSLIQQLQARAKQNSGIIDLAVPQTNHHSWWGSRTAETNYLVIVVPVLSQNVRIATLLMGLPRQSSISLLAIWLFCGTVALIVAAIGGYLLAGKALRPVKTITRAANEISATDLRRRLHLQRQDEFGQLAATFDQMLARLEASFKLQAQFTTDASHELRTPLTIIALEINRG